MPRPSKRGPSKAQIKAIADRAEATSKGAKGEPEPKPKPKAKPKRRRTAAEKKRIEQEVLAAERVERAEEGAQERVELFAIYHEPPEPLHPQAGNTKYDPKIHPGLARKLVLAGLGANDVELADFLQVHARTIATWRVRYPEFAEALLVDEDEQITQSVERALYQRATGYTFDSEKVMSTKDDGIVKVPIREHLPPDVGAARYWLENRSRNKDGSPRWRDSKNLQLSGDADNPIKVDEGGFDFARRMAFLLSQGDNR